MSVPMRWSIALAFVALLPLACADRADAPTAPVSRRFDTIVGNSASKGVDLDHNGYPDAGVYVNGHYTSVYAWDAQNWYWDLGDGRIQGTVGAIDQLDPATFTRCDYVNNYRADFNNDAFMDHGWIQNHINCRGYYDNGQYNYLIVSQDDPRYTGDPARAVWGNWEYHVQTEAHSGNIMAFSQPKNHMGD